MYHYRSVLVVVGIIGLLPCRMSVAADASGIRSDDFDACQLDTSVWSVVDPLGGAGISVEGVGTTNAGLIISVPEGVPHEPSASSNNTIRVLQPAANVDFEIQAKCDSRPTVAGQFQGIIIEEASGHLLRYHVEMVNKSTVLSSATYFGEKEDSRRRQTISFSAPIWLLVRRQADQWKLQYSLTGQTWLDHKAFSQSMTVSRVGLYAGNSATASPPAFNAQFDYFLNPASPFAGEDVTPRSPATTLTRNVVGNGTILADPDRTGYYCGEAVTVTAVPDPGWAFQSWSGDLSATGPVQSIAMSAPRTVTATFVVQSGPPVITAAKVVPSETSALVSWLTDKPSTSRVAYGRTTQYELGLMEDPTLTTSHTMTLTRLSAQTTYHCKLFSSSADGWMGTSSDIGFTTAGGTTSGIVSDDFNSCTLNPATWSVVDPLGGGSVKTTGTGTQNAYLEIAVPAGASHDMWVNKFNGVRAMQTVPNTDFEVVVKFESALNQRYQFQGLFIEQNGGTAIRYDLLYNGAGASLYSATFAGTTAITRREQPIANPASIWLSVRRLQSQFTLRYSLNGTTWSDHASFSFPMTVARMGPFAGNFDERNAPAFTARVDYFLNTAAPLPIEDGPMPGGYTLTRNFVGNGTVTATPDASVYYCSESVVLKATPASGYTFQGWSGDVTGTANPVEVLMNANKIVTATFTGGGAGTVELLDYKLSATTARDGQVIQAGYYITGPASTSVTLGGTLVSPWGQTITDQERDISVSLDGQSRWYNREFLVNLGPSPVYGSYDVTWSIQWPSGNASANQPKGLIINAPVAVRVPILMYHYFAPQSYDSYFVTTQNFRDQMTALRVYGYTPLFFQELVNCRAGVAPIPAKPVVITIDDGCRNQYTEAFPVLMDPAINMKATSFVAISNIDVVDPLYAGLSWSEIQAMQASGHFDIQSHTINHPYLTRLNSQQLANELVNSKQMLEANVGKPVRFISYPYGDANTAVKNAAWQAGYIAGVGAFGGVEQDCASKWVLKRVAIDSTVTVEYDPTRPGSFFFTLIGDPDVVIPKLLINAIQVRDAETDRPLNHGVAARGQKLRVAVVAANWGPGATVVASLALSNNRLIYDSHDVGEDVTTMFQPGPKIFEWNWSVPSTAAAGHYSLSVVFRDEPYVLTWKRSGWKSAFQILD